MSVREDVGHFRTWLAKEPNAIVGGVGGCAEKLTRILDRIDELEWFVSVLRASGMSASGQDPQGLEAKPASPTAESGGAPQNPPIARQP